MIYIDPAYFKTYKDVFSEAQEKADLMLVTHVHGDHCKPATTERLHGTDTRIVAPPRCTRKIRGKVEVIEPGRELDFGVVRVKAVEAYNIERANSKKIWHRKGEGVGYLATTEGKTIYHAGDSDFIPEMKELGHVDVALLPIGGTHTMDLHEAVVVAIAIKPEIVIPMHNLQADPKEYRRKVEARSEIRVVLPEMGEIYGLK